MPSMSAWWLALSFVLPEPSVVPISPDPAGVSSTSSERRKWRSRDQELKRALLGWGIAAGASADMLLAGGFWFLGQPCSVTNVVREGETGGGCPPNAGAIVLMGVAGTAFAIALVGLVTTGAKRGAHHREVRRWAIGPAGSMVSVRF